MTVAFTNSSCPPRAAARLSFLAPALLLGLFAAPQGALAQNQPPAAEISPKGPLTVEAWQIEEVEERTLIGTGTDPEGGAVTYAWSVRNSANEDVTAAVFGSGYETSRWVHFFTGTGGTYTVTLTVTDDAGQTGTATTTIAVNAPPAEGTTIAPPDANTADALAVTVSTPGTDGTTVRVDWSALDFAGDSGGTITGYELDLAPRGRDAALYRTRGERFEFFSRRTTISNLDNGASFTVRVRAKGSGLANGTASHWTPRQTFHTDSGQPNAPEEVTAAAAIRADRLLVRWSAPTWDGGLDIREYYVAYRQALDDRTIGGWIQLPPVTGTVARIDGLAPATAYEVLVRAVNGAGLSPSRIATATTSTGARPNRDSVTVTGRPGDRRGAAVVSWTVADSGMLPITVSRIRYKVRGATGHGVWTRTPNVEGPDTTVTIRNLDPNEEYVAQVKVVNRLGEASNWSKNSARFSPSSANVEPAKPTGLSAAAGDGSIVVSGKARTSDRVTSALVCTATVPQPLSRTGACAASLSFQYFEPDSNGGFSVTLDGLDNGTLYYVALSLTNSEFQGDYSDPVSATPGATATPPAPPTGVTVAPGDASLAVSWTRPASGTTPTGYELCTNFAAPTLHSVPDGTCSDVGTSGIVEAHGADTVSATLDSLVNGRGYYVYVRSVAGSTASTWASTTGTAATAERFTPAASVGGAGGAAGASAQGSRPTVESVTMLVSLVQNIDSTTTALVEAQAAFSEAVTVDAGGGSPTLGIALGGVRREASWQGGSGTRTLTFALDAPDGADASTARAIANGLRLNGATVRGAGGLDAELAFGTAPGVLSVAVAEDAGGDGAWSAGEAAAVTLVFAEPVEVDGSGGTPTVDVTLDGGARRQAAYTQGSGTDTLVFRYVLAAADGTVSTVAVPANGLASNGGAIRSTSGLAADLAHAAASRTGAPPPPPRGLSVADASVVEGPGAKLVFEVTLSEPAAATVRFQYRTLDGTAVGNEDYVRKFGSSALAAGRTRTTVEIRVLDDAHDEGAETLTLKLYNVTGAKLGDGVAVGTIRNGDPMPAAWLARFGSAAAEQALDGVAARLEAPRSAGFEGSVGGQALAFGAGAAPPPAKAPWGGDIGAVGLKADPAGARTMSVDDLLTGSAFTLTGGADPAGGTFAVWGRGAQTRFDGREDTLALDGTVTSGMLGADYARGRWTLGVALLRSEGDGGFADGAMTGDIESSLTAAVPYAALRVSERLDVWAAAGLGSGETTLMPAGGAAIDTDLDWSMAAAGARSALLAPPGGRGGLALALTSDAMWASTSSDAAPGMAASESDVTRLRVGLEGSWPVATAGGGRFVPRVEIGARHDGGDAETGAGVDIGGGIEWSHPGSGLSLELEGRTLLAHEADGREETGYAASFSFDPDPATRQGLSLALRQDWGARASGGLDALFAADPLSGSAAAGHGGDARGRWTAEAAYGFAAFGGRFASGPHAGVGLAPASRDYSVGWRVTPEGPDAPDVSLGLATTRRESAGNEAEHRIALEFRARR